MSQEALKSLIQPEGFPGLPEDWTSREESFTSRTMGLKLFQLTLEKEKKPSHRTLFILHGQGEHGGRYIHFPHYLKDVVDRVVLPDHQGHGRSEGLRGHIQEFDDYVEDAHLLLTRLHETLDENLGQSEIHLFGHSMGGLIALRLLMKYPRLPLASATISAPLLHLRMKVPPVKRVFGEILARSFGSILMENELDPTLVSSDEAVQKAYKTDRLVHSKVSPRWFVKTSKVMKETVEHPNKIDVPMMMVVPTADPICDSEATLKFYSEVQAPVKRLSKYEGFRHESFNEIGKEKAFGDLKEWILKHQKKEIKTT